jgi:putative peptidoglycan lipid II flippase
MPQDRTTTLRDRAAFSTYATAVQGLARLVYSVLIGHFGSRELLGQTNSALSLSVLTSQLWAAPAGGAGTKFVALREALGDEEGAKVVARHITTRTALLSLVLPAVVAVSGAVWLDFGPAQVVGTVVVAVAYSLYTTLRGVTYGHLRFRQVALWDTIAGATALVAVTVVLVLDLTALTLLPLALGYAVFVVACRPARAKGRVEPQLRREIDHFVLFGAVSGLASGGLLQLSQIAAHWSGGSSAAGDFAAALTLATPTSMLSFALSTVLIPPLVAAAGREDWASVRTQEDAIMRRLVAIFVGLFGTLVLASPLIIDVIWGEEYRAAGAVLPILLVAVMLTSIALGATTAMMVTRSWGPRLVAGLNVSGLVVSVALWPWLSDRFGIVGVAVGYLLGAGTASVAAVVVVWRAEKQAWLGLAARLVGGTALFVGLAALVRVPEGGARLAAEIGAVLLFAGVWLALSRRDVLALWATVRGGAPADAS